MALSFFVFGLCCFMVGFYSNKILNYKEFNAYKEAFHKLQIWVCARKKLRAEEVGAEAARIYWHFKNGGNEKNLFSLWAAEDVVREKILSLKNSTEKI